MTVAVERPVGVASVVGGTGVSTATGPSLRGTADPELVQSGAPTVPRRERIDNDLLRRYQADGDLQARERLVERCMAPVHSVANRYAGPGQDTEDLTQAGLIGLTNAIERFDVRRGGRFVSYTVPNIRGEILKHFRDHTWAVHVPRGVQELDARLQRARAQTLHMTGREAGVEDLAQMLHVTTDEVLVANAAGRNYRALSLDQPATEGADPFASHGAVDPGYSRIENLDLAERAMRGINERDRKVVRWAFDDGLLQREIGERIGVSQMQVSRILKAALARMRDHSRGPRTV